MSQSAESKTTKCEFCDKQIHKGVLIVCEDCDKKVKVVECVKCKQQLYMIFSDKRITNDNICKYCLDPNRPKCCSNIKSGVRCFKKNNHNGECQYNSFLSMNDI